MSKRLAQRFGIFATVAAVALGSTGVALARQGADDPPGDQRQSRGADDAQPHLRHGADDRRAHHARHHKRHGHGADDPAGHR